MTQNVVSVQGCWAKESFSSLLLHPPLPIADGWTVNQERRGRGGEEATAPPAAAKNI